MVAGQAQTRLVRLNTLAALTDTCEFRHGG
jgi:hypothetical protein